MENPQLRLPAVVALLAGGDDALACLEGSLQESSPQQLPHVVAVLGRFRSDEAAAILVTLLEKSQGTLHAIRATPLTSTTYIASKALTLTAFAVVESAVVYMLGFFGVPVNPWLLALGVAALGVLYTLIGMGQVARHDSVTSFLMLSPAPAPTSKSGRPASRRACL